MLTIDRRERALSHALGGIPHVIQELPVGDVTCHYEADGDNWVAERKTAADLAASIADGRLSEQTARLHVAGYRQIFWFVEGDLHDRGVPYESLLSACVNMSSLSDGTVC